MEFPDDLRYAKEHGWVRPAGAEAVLGISDHAQKELGDVVYVELPQPGTVITRGLRYGLVESVKAVSDLVAPIGGKVLRVNEELSGAPELLNQDPYGRGWTIAVEPAGGGELEGLLSAADYRTLVEQLAGGK